MEAKARAAEALERSNSAADEAERWKDECLHLKKDLAAHNRKCAETGCTSTKVVTSKFQAVW